MKVLHQKKWIVVLSMIVFCLMALSACTKKTSESNVESMAESKLIVEEAKTAVTAPDYADANNWAYYESGSDKSVDVFLICPTVDMGANGNMNMAMDDENVRANFLGALNMERGIYDTEGAMFSPYYRQASFPVYSLSSDEAETYFETAYEDVKAAFLYYMENENNGRPLVLAGFSQGSDMALRLLKDVFEDSAYQEQLVAAYCIGWRVTQEDLDAYPWLVMAEGEFDTGSIIAFNSEAEGVTESILVPEGVKTFGINPLNWYTDSTFADKSLNIGACFTDYAGDITSETAELTGAYLDENRGTLILPDIDPAEYSNGLFPDGVYHLYDYQFFYRNLQQNVADRIDAYMAALEDAAA